MIWIKYFVLMERFVDLICGLESLKLKLNLNFIIAWIQILNLLNKV